jgi:hypothetical protein
MKEISPMRKIIALAAALYLAGSGPSAAFSSKAVCYVAPNGNNAHSGLSPRVYQRAADRAPSFLIAQVLTGAHREQLIMPPLVRLQSAPRLADVSQTHVRRELVDVGTPTLRIGLAHRVTLPEMRRCNSQPGQPGCERSGT